MKTNSKTNKYRIIFQFLKGNIRYFVGILDIFHDLYSV